VRHITRRLGFTGKSDGASFFFPQGFYDDISFAYYFDSYLISLDIFPLPFLFFFFVPPHAHKKSYGECLSFQIRISYPTSFFFLASESSVFPPHTYNTQNSWVVLQTLVSFFFRKRNGIGKRRMFPYHHPIELMGK
jgi:hypothetical protein